MIRYTALDNTTQAHWAGTGPLTPEKIETEALTLWRSRAEARARRTREDICHGLSDQLTALAYLALKTDFGADAAAADELDQARCVADYLSHWGAQLQSAGLITGLYGSTTISLLVREMSFVYRIRYRPHYLGNTTDHFDVQLIDENRRPSATPNPVTQTGYRSVFVSSAEVDQIGCPKAWISAYLNQCAKQWQPLNLARQLCLFDDT